MRADWNVSIKCMWCSKKREPKRRANGVKESPSEIRRQRFCSVQCRGAFNSADGERRFWKKVFKTLGCWWWQGAKTREGYGRITYLKRCLLAHRFAWVLATGDRLNPKDFICHKCDNPACVRQSHLFKGDALANTRDKIAKGRARYLSGEENPSARFTADEVKQFREARAQGWRVKDLAEAIGAHVVVVSRLLNGRTYP